MSTQAFFWLLGLVGLGVFAVLVWDAIRRWRARAYVLDAVVVWEPGEPDPFGDASDPKCRACGTDFRPEDAVVAARHERCAEQHFGGAP